MPKRGRPAKAKTPPAKGASAESEATKTQVQEKRLSEASTSEERMAMIKEISKGIVLDNGMNIGTLGGALSISEGVRGVIPTGSLGLDLALGVGGYPKGRIVEVFGAESSGKTTLALHAIAECQRAGGIAAYIDAEHALDVGYAAALGVDIDALIFHQPSSGEEALQTVQKLVDTGNVDLIIVDSVAALTPKAELEGEIGDAHVGQQARLMGQAMRMLCGRLLRTNTVLLFINQIRFKVNVQHGSPKTTPGGEALKFYASVRIEVIRIGQLTQGDERSGSRTKLLCIKNKVAPPFKFAEVDINFGEGISMYGEIIDYGVEAGVVQKSGAWYSYGDRRLGQGKENSIQKIKDDTALGTELLEKVRAYITARK